MKMVDRCGFNENDPRKWERDWDEKKTPKTKRSAMKMGDVTMGVRCDPTKHPPTTSSSKLVVSQPIFGRCSIAPNSWHMELQGWSTTVIKRKYCFDHQYVIRWLLQSLACLVIVYPFLDSIFIPWHFEPKSWDSKMQNEVCPSAHPLPANGVEIWRRSQSQVGNDWSLVSPLKSINAVVKSSQKGEYMCTYIYISYYIIYIYNIILYIIYIIYNI